MVVWLEELFGLGVQNVGGWGVVELLLLLSPSDWQRIQHKYAVYFNICIMLSSHNKYLLSLTPDPAHLQARVPYPSQPARAALWVKPLFWLGV